MEKLSKLKVLKLASGLSEATYSYCWTLLTIMLPLGGLIHVTWVVSALFLSLCSAGTQNNKKAGHLIWNSP